MKRGLLGVAFALAATVLFSAAARAAYEVPLRGTLNFQGAQGVAVIDEGVDTIYEQERIKIRVEGLKPNSVYTAWLSKDKPGERLMGLGAKPYSFRTDSAGYGSFVTEVGEGDTLRWDKIEIAYHPNNDPADMQNSQIALSGRFGGIFD